MNNQSQQEDEKPKGHWVSCVGFLIGLPSLRLKIDYILIMIWGFIVIINLMARNWPAAFNGTVVMFYLFVIKHLKKQMKEYEL